MDWRSSELLKLQYAYMTCLTEAVKSRLKYNDGG